MRTKKRIHIFLSWTALDILFSTSSLGEAFSICPITPHQTQLQRQYHKSNVVPFQKMFTSTIAQNSINPKNEMDSNSIHPETDIKPKKKIAVIGAGWGGLSVAHALSKHHKNKNESFEITVIEASKRVGGLVRDGFTTINGTYPAEAGQHGFWDNYHNIFHLLEHDIPGFSFSEGLTDYAEQGQYSPKGLEAIWPVYRNQPVILPTGLAQAFYTKFTNLSPLDRLTAAPLVLAFSEFDDSIEAWKKYDNISFRDLCVKLGVSKKCYEEAFEPMILTGLFAPGAECSAAAALGMAYFFVLKSQTSFDVRWCKGNIGNIIFDPWVQEMKRNNVQFETSTRVTGFQFDPTKNGKEAITSIQCSNTDNGEQFNLDVDTVVFAVGAEALNAFVRYSPSMAKYPEFRRFANLRGTSVLATRIFLDRKIKVPYSANACWGFDDGIGMTMFDITTIHEVDKDPNADFSGSILEVDYYHASPLLVMDNISIVAKVKEDLDTILGTECKSAKVVDAAVVKLPKAVNWYYPGSYADMPDVKSNSVENLFFVGDIVRTRHGSWSQEKAFVTGIQAANKIMGSPINENVIPLSDDEAHVAFGRNAVSLAKYVAGFGDKSRGPSLADFLG